jgi:hypothetical protein
MIQSAHYYALFKVMTITVFNGMSNRSGQHENERLMTVLPMRRGRNA